MVILFHFQLPNSNKWCYNNHIHQIIPWTKTPPLHWMLSKVCKCSNINWMSKCKISRFNNSLNKNSCLNLKVSLCQMINHLLLGMLIAFVGKLMNREWWFNVRMRIASLFERDGIIAAVWGYLMIKIKLIPFWEMLAFIALIVGFVWEIHSTSTVRIGICLVLRLPWFATNAIQFG